jgi:hypothetical protein
MQEWSAHYARPALNRALSKAIAHKAAGNQGAAEQWAAHLLYLLDVMDLANQSRLDAYDASQEPTR